MIDVVIDDVVIDVALFEGECSMRDFTCPNCGQHLAFENSMCLSCGGALGFSLDEREVRRAGLDYWPRVQPVVWEDWDALEAAFPAIGEPFFFSAEAPREIWDVRFPTRSVLVFGRESGGLPDELRRRHFERFVCIPMADTRMRSLNVSTAVAVVLYEALRQRRRT